jgi:hypothetical protein
MAFKKWKEKGRERKGERQRKRKKSLLYNFNSGT